LSPAKHYIDFSLSGPVRRSLLDVDAWKAPRCTAVPLLATFAGLSSYYISQEFQLSGDITDRLNFITGAYYGKEHGDETSRSQIFGGLIRDSNAEVTNKTFGLFAQFYYEITPELRAVGGARYTWVLHNAQVFGLPYNAPERIRQHFLYVR